MEGRRTMREAGRRAVRNMGVQCHYVVYASYHDLVNDEKEHIYVSSICSFVFNRYKQSHYDRLVAIQGFRLNGVRGFRKQMSGHKRIYLCHEVASGRGGGSSTEAASLDVDASLEHLEVLEVEERREPRSSISTKPENGQSLISDSGGRARVVDWNADEQFITGDCASTAKSRTTKAVRLISAQISGKSIRKGGVYRFRLD
ncbi:hypothetical protein B0H19DRAFT_98297 [Mycena capillaripes]|nr:hypothetical protein B0H19DRAFT_98297 [Mycena capillaripes]